MTEYYAKQRRLSKEQTPYKGQLYLGTLWCLKEFDNISAPQISELINWECNKVRDEIRRIIESSTLTFYIEVKENDNRIKTLSLDKDLKILPLDTLAKLGRTMFDRKIRFDKMKKEKTKSKINGTMLE